MNFQHVNNLWNEVETTKLAGVDRLVYRSNKLGSDQRITNTGGGNTSSKLAELDPLTKGKVEVLWVKGSGGDLHTTFNLNPRASSIDTPLHSFIPARHVDHTHPNAIIAIAATPRCERLTKE